MNILNCDRESSEADFQNAIIKLAKEQGWLVYHTHDSRRSQAGFPDLVMIKGNYLIVAELKNRTGKLSEAQTTWVKAFEAVNITNINVWKPGTDNDEIVEMLLKKGN